MRRPALTFAVALVLPLVGGTAASSATSAATRGSAPSIRVAFSGSAEERMVDVERWVLLSSGECYLRHLRDQKTALNWNVTFAGARSLAAQSASTISGAVTGTEVRDSCDDVAEELPPDAPDDWIHSFACSDPVRVVRPARATWTGGVLRVNAPVTVVGKTAVCTAVPRSEELNARIRLPATRINALPRGGRIRVAVGSARPATGSYRPRANCLHSAKPYDGYRSFDQCVDTMKWSGVVTITRL